MARFTRLAAMGLLLLMATWGTALAATPNLLQYQGRLTDNAGTPLNGAFTVTFTIYADSLGTTNLWTETRSVTCANGLFSITLGTGTAIGASVFNATTRFMGIRVAPDAADMLPRQRIASSGFAHRAAEADHAADSPGISTRASTGAFSSPVNAAAVVDSVSITIPAAGFIVVNASGGIYISHTNGIGSSAQWKLDEARFNASVGPGWFHSFCISALPTGSFYTQCLNLSRTYQKPAGAYRFYLNVESSGEAHNIERHNITAMYFPSLYGSASEPPPAPGLGAESIEPVGTVGPNRQP